jgi:hypothetical protein
MARGNGVLAATGVSALVVNADTSAVDYTTAAARTSHTLAVSRSA